MALRVDNKRIFPQDVQQGQTSHPPNPGAPRRAFSQARPQLRDQPSVHGSWERCENAAGRHFQHSVKVLCEGSAAEANAAW